MVDTQVRPDVSAIRTSLTQIKPTRGMKIFNVVNVTLLSLFSIAIIVPFVNLIAVSFSSSGAIRAGQVTFWPVGFNTATFVSVFRDSWFWLGYWNTVRYTAIYVALAMAITTTFAYAISRPNLRGKSFFIGLAVFTMFFGGGIIPNFLLITRVLGWRDQMWAIVVPGALSVFNLLVMKSFFENFPTELIEAGQLDGASHYGIFFRIVLPLSKAVLATMTLFYAVGMWNSWFGAMVYLDSRPMFPIMLYLRNLIVQSNLVENVSSDDQADIGRNVGAVAMLLTTLPIMCVYPFVQKYFVSGVMLGSVKG